MSNMADCIARAVDFGAVDRARGVAATNVYQQLYDRYRTTMPDAAAAAAATKDLKEATKAAKTRRYHAVLNQLQAMRRIQGLIEASPDPALAIRNLLEFSEGSGFTGESVETLTRAFNASIRADIKEVLDDVGLNVVGQSRDKARLGNVIRELHGDDTGDGRAKHLAAAIRKAQQRMRRLFNAHGGDIGDLADYGMPHAHDAGRIMRAGFDGWARAIEGRLAWHRIPDLTTGKPFAAAPGTVPPRAVTERFLRDVYDGIVTRGWDDRDPSMSVGGRAIYNQRADHRVLHFATGQDWIEYNKTFGSSDPFSAMIGGLNGLARDVALMRVLGPNPRTGLNFAIQVAQKRAAAGVLAARTPQETKAAAKLAERVVRTGKLAGAMLSHLNGSANIPDHAGWAAFFSGTRAVLTSAQLGSAVLSSTSDLATMQMAAQAVGMSGSHVIARSVQLMASQATRETAARMGYVANTLADAGGGASRYFGETFATGLPDRLASFTLRATGLTFLTDMRRMAFQMEFSGFMADNADRAFGQIDAPLRRIFQERGISPADWDLLRDPSVRFKADTGADFISPMYWLEAQTTMPRVEAEGLAMRLQMAIEEQLEYAMPTAKVEGRARLQGEAPPGSFLGELARSAMSYKSFALSLTMGQYRRYMAIPTPIGKAKYAASMSALLIVTGAMAVQLKELAKGNDPRPMTDGKFLMAALFQGGGLGIFGDFFWAETSRVGGGIAETIAGPVVGLGSDLIKPVASNITRAISGEDTLVGRDVAGLVRRYTPFASSGWPVRVAYSRLVADELQAFLDPEAEVLMRRRLRQQAKDYGTQPFVPSRGSGDSFRAPDLSNAFRSTP